jgi:hypothetical protein
MRVSAMTDESIAPAKIRRKRPPPPRSKKPRQGWVFWLGIVTAVVTIVSGLCQVAVAFWPESKGPQNAGRGSELVLESRNSRTNSWIVELPAINSSAPMSTRLSAHIEWQNHGPITRYDNLSDLTVPFDLFFGGRKPPSID